MGQVVGAMEDAGNGLNIVILDACRNTPFTRSWRSSQVGLAAPPTARGMLIAMRRLLGGWQRTAQTATASIPNISCRPLDDPGLSIEQVFKQVRSGVVTETSGHQTPWESSSLLGRWCLCQRPPPPGRRGRQPPRHPRRSGNDDVAQERALGASGGGEAFLQGYLASRFAPAARVYLQQFRPAEPGSGEHHPTASSAPARAAKVIR